MNYEKSTCVQAERLGLPAGTAAGPSLVPAAAVDRGHVSVRRAAALVGLPIEDLEELCAVHRVEHAIDL